MENLMERIEQLNESMRLVREEFERLDNASKRGGFCCATNLLSTIHRHKVMRLKFLIDIEKEFVIPSEIMQLAGAAVADHTFVDGGSCYH